jgi:hypothetical protein
MVAYHTLYHSLTSEKGEWKAQSCDNAWLQQLQKKRALPPKGRGRNGYGWRAILAVLAGHGANAVLVSEAHRVKASHG